MDKRLPWPEYFMRIAHLVAERATCTRRKVGAVAVKDKRILATGYNGPPQTRPIVLMSDASVRLSESRPDNAMSSAAAFMLSRT